MPHFFIILVKINLVLLLFAAAYYLTLRRLTFYVINRIFLVFGMLFATIYPFIDLTAFFYAQNQKVIAFVPQINQQVKELVPENFLAAHWQFISVLFGIGVVLMGVRLIIQFLSLYKMHLKSAPGKINNYPVRILNEAVSPFSFWQTVYINPQLHQEKELNNILAHENIHVKEWHSLDIILAELSVVFYWFNPGVWLMKKAVKENLEFITDHKILKKGIDRKAYQYSLLDVGNLRPAVEIVNNFNLNDLKKRIQMMNVKPSSKLTLSRYLFLAPVLLATTLAFTVSKKEVKQHLIPLKQVLIDARLMDAPAQVITASIIKKSIPVKKARPKKEEIVIDSIAPTKILYITTMDSVSRKPEVINLLVAKRDQDNAEAGQDNAPKVNVFQFKGHVEGVQIEPVHTDETSKQEQPITVVGHATRKSFVTQSQIDQVQIKLKGASFQAADTAFAKANFTLILNGKKAAAKELKGVDPEQIKNIRIKKEIEKKLDEVTIIGRTSKQ